ncbi:MAG: hypothetical protein AAGG01_15465 [Planctomycetota bacterium]
MGLVEGIPKGKPLPWPGDFEPVLTRHNEPNATYRYRIERDGVRFWPDRRGFWTLRLPDLPGFKKGQEATVWFGEDTELGIQPVGLEPE